jgi:hypothetical protein
MERRAQKVSECDACGNRTVLFTRAGKHNDRHPCCGKVDCVKLVHAYVAEHERDEAADKAAGRSFW